MRAIAASSALRSVTSTSSGRAMPASRSSALLSDSDSVADFRCAERSRGGSAATSAGGASLNFARSTICRMATPAWVNPDSTTTPDFASSLRAKCDGSV